MDKLEALKSYFGYDSYRKNQAAIIDSLLSLNDTIAIMATGGGKSICFQIPGLIKGGLTVVITPLISLMTNQVEELKKRRIKAVFINSEQDFFEQKIIVNNLEKGLINFLYISPEKLENESFVSFIYSLNVSFVIVDEAHCVSVWGNDFRLSYKQIKYFLLGFSKRPVVGAFTATADKYVIKDIASLIGLNDYNIFKSTFDRPNLFYGVYSPKCRFDFLVKYLLKRKNEIGIIYCLTRKEVESLAKKLFSLGFLITKYHGGLTAQEKLLNQNDFMSEKVKIIVATNAFGMGINKENIRFVINYDLPLTMEDLVQQSGRCSRDNLPGECLLLFAEDTLKTAEYFIKKTKAISCDETKRIIAYKYKKLKNVIEYATTKKCLHQYIVDYFGELNHVLCNNCTNCQKKRQKK